MHLCEHLFDNSVMGFGEVIPQKRHFPIGAHVNSLTTKEFLQTCFVAIVTIDSKTGPKNRDIFLLKF